MASAVATAPSVLPSSGVTVQVQTSPRSVSAAGTVSSVHSVVSGPEVPVKPAG